jgi:hypothetical protein
MRLIAATLDACGGPECGRKQPAEPLVQGTFFDFNTMASLGTWKFTLSATSEMSGDCNSAYDLTADRIPAVTLVRRPVNSSLQGDPACRLGADLDGDQGETPRRKTFARTI